VQFVCGVVDKQGVRRILTAESTPTLENIDDAARRMTALPVDWGPEADQEASRWAAWIILDTVTGAVIADRYCEQYAAEVVRKLSTDRMWLLPVGEVEEWLRTKQKVN